MFRSDQRRMREFFLDCREDLHALDGIYPEVGVKTHVEVEHFDRITGFFADNGQECRCCVCRWGGACTALCCCGRRMRRPCNSSGTEEGGYFTQGLKRPEMLRPDQRRVREPFLDGGEDLHALDGVYTEVGVETHVEVEHLDRITGLLADDCEYRCGNGRPCRSGCCLCRFRF